MIIPKQTFAASWCWINTAFSNAFRTLEIPFVIYFLSSSGKSDTALLGIILAIITAASGFISPLATPTASGRRPRNCLRIFLYGSGISLFISFLLLLIIYLKTSVTTFPVLSILFFLVLGLCLIAVRRVYQGALIYAKHSGAITTASFLRIATTIPLTLFLPQHFANVEVAMYILLLGALVDTSYNVLAYYILNKKMNSYCESDFTLKKYLQISLAATANLLNNYWIILTLNWFTNSKTIYLWAILYSCISIFTGIYAEIENIVIRFQMYWKNMLFLLFPISLGLILSYYLFFNQRVSILYFTNFQGIEDLKPILSLRFYVILLMLLYLCKAASKGIALWLDQAALTNKAAWSGLAILILLSPLTLLYGSLGFALVLLLAGILVELLVLLLGKTVKNP